MPISFSPWRNSARCGNCGRASRMPAGSRPQPAFVSAETAWRMMTRARSAREHPARHHRRVRGRPRRRRRDHRPAVHRRARSARPVCAPHRAQHPAHPARGIATRQGRRSGRRLRRARRPDRCSSAARPGRSFRRSKRPAVPAAALESGLIQHKVAAVRAERAAAVARRKDALTGASDLSRPRRSAQSRCSRRSPRVVAAAPPSKCSSRCRDPPRRAFRSVARRLRPDSCRRPARGRKSSSPISARRRSSPRARPLPATFSRPAASRR